jgi:hypothetical protein
MKRGAQPQPVARPALTPETFAIWRADPARFASEALGLHLWAKQIEILEAMKRHRRVAVASCHESGKTFVASVAAMWGMVPHVNSIVVSTAPGNRQVQSLLGAEIAARFVDLRKTCGGAADSDLGGMPNPSLSGWSMDRSRYPKWYWIGFATSADQEQEHATKFVGFHPAENGWLTLIFDEACGIGPAIWHAAQGLMTSDRTRQLAIGNPTDSTGEFARCWRDPDWHKITISAFDCPNLQHGAQPGGWGVTREYVERMARKYGVESAAYQAKVLGQFPSAGTDTLISTGMVQRAIARAAVPCRHPDKDIGIGVDVARYGDDQTVFYVVCWACNAILEVRERGGQDLMWTAGETLALAVRWHLHREHARQISVDDTGLGGGVTDRLREQEWNVNGENFGGAPKREREDEERFRNRRTELWWHLREWVDEAASLSALGTEEQDQLFADLTTPKYKYDSDGTIALEPKADIKKRLSRSPDHGDALALAVASRGWGRRPVAPGIVPPPRLPDDREDEEDDAKNDAARLGRRRWGPVEEMLRGTNPWR